MYDRSMPDAHLEMRRPGDLPVPECSLPQGFALSTYRPGDEAAWCEIEATAGEFPSPAEGMPAFDRYFRADALLLPGRMFFAVDGAGLPVATATAWFSGDRGMLHWVAVHVGWQGRGLARPVIAAALRRLWELGYAEFGLGTQPASWVAIRLYLEFGFRPVWEDDPAALAGWRTVYAKLGKEFVRELCFGS